MFHQRECSVCRVLAAVARPNPSKSRLAAHDCNSPEKTNVILSMRLLVDIQILASFTWKLRMEGTESTQSEFQLSKSITGHTAATSRYTC